VSKKYLEKGSVLNKYLRGARLGLRLSPRGIGCIKRGTKIGILKLNVEDRRSRLSSHQSQKKGEWMEKDLAKRGKTKYAQFLWVSQASPNFIGRFPPAKSLKRCDFLLGGEGLSSGAESSGSPRMACDERERLTSKVDCSTRGKQAGGT